MKKLLLTLSAFLFALPAFAARDGSGTMSLPYPTFTPGATISSSQFNANNSAITSEITNSIAADGQTTPSANLKMGGFKFTGLGSGSALTDSANLGQVQNQAYIWCGTAGGTKNALTCTPSPAITAYAAGQIFRFKVGASQTDSTVTLQVSGLSSPVAVQSNGAALSSSIFLEASKWYEALYDGTNFQVRKFFTPDGVLSPAAGSSAITTIGAATATSLSINSKNPILASTKQVFTSSGTYTPTAGMTYAIIECLGGGGAGGGVASSSSNGAAGGGGAGSYSRVYVAAATVGSSQTVTIGAGGTPGTAGNNAGGNGGDTSVGTLCVGKGGSGGNGSAANSRSGGGAGGVAGTGDLTGTGEGGFLGNNSASTGWAGRGGSTQWGSGGLENGGAGNGTAGTGYGSGGSGGLDASSGGNRQGGAGTAGIVIITEFLKQ